MVNVHLESKLTLDLTQVPAKVARILVQKATHKDPYYHILRRSGFPIRGIPRHIRTYEEDGQRLRLWRGMLGTVVRVLKRFKVEYEVIDNRLWLPKVRMPCSITLRDYQRDPVHRMIQRQQTVGRGPCGSGKTECMLKLAAHFQQPTLVLVWDGRQQKTWLDRVPQYFDFEPGGIGGAFKTPKLDSPIVVGMLQSVRNRLPTLKYQFGCVICDEVQRFAATTFREVINEMPAAVRLGSSDDERRRDGREFLLYDTFGPLSWQLKPGTGQCTVSIHLVPTGFKYSGVDFEPFEWTDVVDELIEDECRNRIILNLTAREVNDGHRVLIWSDRVDHCRHLKRKLLAAGFRAGLVLGGSQQKAEADATEDGLREGTIEIGIGTSPAEQSINVPPLDRGIMTCASASQKMFRFKQMRGRLARPCESKKDARLYYIWDRAVPRLKRKARNINRRYQTKVVRHNFHLEGEEAMAGETLAVTLETLKAGCKQLVLTVPKGATQKKLERLIDRELSKDPTYGAFTCGACQRDIVDGINPCPWCQAKFKPLPDEAPDEPEVDETEEELEEEPEDGEDLGEGPKEGEPEDEGEESEKGKPEDEDEGEVFYVTDALKKEVKWDEEGQPVNVKEVTEDGYPVVYDGEGKCFWADEAGELQAFEEEEPEEEAEPEEEPEEETDPDEEPAEDEWEDPEAEPEEEPEQPAAKKAASKKPSKKAQEKKRKEKEREEKRKQVRSELPYSGRQLTAMKRQTLIMVASVLGVKDPLKTYKTTEALVKAILLLEKKKWPKRFAKKATTKKTATKKTSKRRR